MKKWNLLLTSYRNERKFLLEELEDYSGEFTPTDFRDVVVGHVSNINDFLDEMKENYIPSLARVIPIQKTFQFEKDTFKEKAKEAIKPLTKKIEKEETFAVRCERRGFKDVFSSQEIEREIGSYIWKQLEVRGIEPEVDLEDPKKLIIIEMLGKKAGVNIITKNIRNKYELVRMTN